MTPPGLEHNQLPTHRARCVPPEALIGAATAKTKALKRGTAGFPVLVFMRGNASYAGLPLCLP
jgi:hypothetical protein